LFDFPEARPAEIPTILVDDALVQNPLNFAKITLVRNRFDD
jgi:hypothetical protein